MKISLIIPAWYANKELEKMTIKCLASQIDPVDETILQIDPVGEGYTKTVNKALKRVGGGIIIVGNNDLLFPKGWVRKLISVLEEGFDLATCWTSDQHYTKEAIITESDKFGALFAMTRMLYETVGPLDEQFKGYFSDTDYRRRLLDSGFRIGMNRDLVIEHIAKATYKVTDENDIEFKKAKILYERKWGYGQD